MKTPAAAEGGEKVSSVYPNSTRLINEESWWLCLRVQATPSTATTTTEAAPAAEAAPQAESGGDVEMS